MVTHIVNNVLNIQNKLESILDSSKDDIPSNILEELLEHLNKLVIKTCKTKSFNEFNTYFTINVGYNYDTSDFIDFTEQDYHNTQKFANNSTSLKNKLYNTLNNNGIPSKNAIGEQNDDLKLMKFNNSESKNRILEASDKVSLSMDIGGTFIKIMFKFKIESDLYYNLLKSVYAGYLDCLHVIQHFHAHNQTKTLGNGHSEQLSQMLEFMFSVFLSIKVEDGILAFKYVPITELDLVVSTIKEKSLHSPGKSINVTGGGAYKQYDHLVKEFHNVNQDSEVMCTVHAINFIHKINNSVIEYDLNYRFPRITTMEPVYPYLICSAGSGMFILKVSSPTEYTHLNGSAISGGTAFGIVNYTLPLNEPRKFIKDLKTGTNAYDTFSTHSTETFKTSNKTEPYGLFTSLGKLSTDNNNDSKGEDLNKSIMDMISYNTGEIGYLVAKAYDVKRVIITGNYICNHTMESIAAGFSYCSDVYEDKSIQLCFPFQAAYIPIIGSFILER